MMRFRDILKYITIIVFVTLSCNKKLELSREYIELLTEKVNIDQAGESIILIVPPASCIPCGNYAVDKSPEIIRSNSHVNIIFECFPDNYIAFCNKLHEIKIPLHSIEIDTTLQFSKLDSIVFPTIIYIEEGKVKRVELLNSKNPYAIDNLISKLNQK
jgi:hypothetical protein